MSFLNEAPFDIQEYLLAIRITLVEWMCDSEAFEMVCVEHDRAMDAMQYKIDGELYG